MKGTPEELAHYKKVVKEIDHELTMLQMTYDTKTLATIMFSRAARMLRVLHSMKMWESKDVEVFISNIMLDVLDPIDEDEIPEVKHHVIGQPGKPN